MKQTLPSLDKSQRIQTYLIWLLSFLALTAMEVFLLAGVSLIPRQAIKTHTQESAEYYMEKEVFYRIQSNNPASQIDHYADAILLNVLYHFDSKHPIASSLTASYYYTDTQNENANLLTALTSNVEPTYDYFRYWHGSTVLVRPLLTFLNIQQIYIMFAVMLATLTAILLILLFRYRHPACAWSVILSYVAVSFWFIPMSLEYIWCFLIMITAGIIIILCNQKKKTVTGLFFLLIGNLTAYFDFLTTETLTLLFPLALLLISMYEDNRLQSAKDGFKLVICHSLSWGIGYLSSWIAKWTITSIVLSRNVFGEAFSSASVRVNGSTETAHGVVLSINALFRNISCLLPFNLIKSNGAAFALCGFIFLLIIYYLFRKSEKNNFIPWLLATLCAIPYLRYLILANHSFLHYFFTYRAQFTSIFCLCMIFHYGIDRKLVSKTFQKFK